MHSNKQKQKEQKKIDCYQNQVPMIGNYVSDHLFEYSKYEVGYKSIFQRVLFNVFINCNIF